MPHGERIPHYRQARPDCYSYGPEPFLTPRRLLATVVVAGVAIGGVVALARSNDGGVTQEQRECVARNYNDPTIRNEDLQIANQQCFPAPEKAE